jgi:starch synthase
MRLLFVTSEVEPFSKTGGLADVLGALPRALAERGHEVLVVSPRYGELDPRLLGLQATGKWVSVRFPFGEQFSEIFVAQGGPRLRFAFLEHAMLYQRKGIYGDAGGDFGDNHRRYAYLSRACLEVARALDFTPDILHAHDWPTGLAPLYLREARGDLRFAHTRSVFTIHNLGYQGIFSKQAMSDLGLSWSYFNSTGLEFFDKVNFLKSGLGFADAISTVSRRYAEEIQTTEQGFRLEATLRSRRHRLVGILNGIDPTEWNPAADAALPSRYSRDEMAGKARCRHALTETFGVQAGPQTLVIGLVSRLAHQKGVDLVLQASQALMQQDIALVMLGNGEARLEDGFRGLTRTYRGRVGAHIGFDRALSHRVIAGCDALLMPSRYEPCGLSQLYGLRYGTVPIVRATGGLDDTVIDATQPDGNGFKFNEFNVPELVDAVARAAWTFRQPERWRALVRRGMARDYSWAAASRQYESLYRELLHER